MRACRWRAPIEHRAADLVQHGRGALLVGWIDDVGSSASIAGSSCRPFKRSDPVSLMAEISTASASSNVASRLASTRCAAGVSRPKRGLAFTTGWLTARNAAPAGHRRSARR